MQNISLRFSSGFNARQWHLATMFHRAPLTQPIWLFRPSLRPTAYWRRFHGGANCASGRYKALCWKNSFLYDWWIKTAVHAVRAIPKNRQRSFPDHNSFKNCSHGKIRIPSTVTRSSGLQETIIYCGHCPSSLKARSPLKCLSRTWSVALNSRAHEPIVIRPKLESVGWDGTAKYPNRAPDIFWIYDMTAYISLKKKYSIWERI